MTIDIKKENILARMQLPGSPYQLALLRILLGIQIFYSSSSKVFDLLQVVDGSGKPTIFPSFVDDLIAENVNYLIPIVKFLSVALVLGILTKYITYLLTISFILLFGFLYSEFDAPVPWIYIWFPLIILSFSRCSDVWSVDRLLKTTHAEKTSLSVYRWPIEMIIGWFAYIYVAAGIAKIIPFSKGFVWLDGATSQKIVYERFLDSLLYYVLGKPFFDYTGYSFVFSSLSILSIIIELSCIILYFTSKFNYWILFFVLSMHFFLYLVGVPGFGQLAAILGVSLINPKFFIEILEAR